MASTATATMAASTGENRTVAFEAIEASGESQYLEEHRADHGQQDEVVAAAATEQQHPVARQSSLLTLTLEEIQNTMCGPGKNFGSMNMDEFLTNIWTAEEGTAMASAGGGGVGDASATGSGVGHPNDQPGAVGGPDATSNVGTPPALLHRQGSVSLPANMCRKTVDEVWSEIQRDQQRQHHHHPPPPPPPPQGYMQPQQYQCSGSAQRQPTFGKMTLEDFLIKAGVVREGGYLCSSSPQRLNQFPLPTSPQQQHSPCGLLGSYPMVNERSGYGPIQMTMAFGDHQNPGSTANGAYHNYHHQQQGAVGNGYGGGGVSYGGGDSGGGRMGNGHGGVGSPVSATSSDGFGGRSQVDNSSSNPGGQWGADVDAGSRAGGVGAAAGGRKRILDGPVDKVMERRQRRMIKNRESAARSRARKQAYTVELETELNQLKEENARLHEEQRRLTARRRQMLLENMAERARTNSQRNAKALRHSSSCVW